MKTDAVPVGGSEDPPRAVLGSEELVESERNVTPVNVALGRNPGSLDLPAPLASPYANETTTRPRANTPFMVPRPTPITHTDVTEARPNTLRHEIESEPRHITNTTSTPNFHTFTRLFYETFSLRSKVAGITCIFMNEHHGALLATARHNAALYQNYLSLGRLISLTIRCYMNRHSPLLLPLPQSVSSHLLFLCVASTINSSCFTDDG